MKVRTHSVRGDMREQMQYANKERNGKPGQKPVR